MIVATRVLQVLTARLLPESHAGFADMYCSFLTFSVAYMDRLATNTLNAKNESQIATSGSLFG